jgi:aconitate hydratase
MDTIRTFTTGTETEAKLHSLPVLSDQGFDKISCLPLSIRSVLESLLRNCDGKKANERGLKIFPDPDMIKRQFLIFTQLVK